jgi:hypothetical protein
VSPTLQTDTDREREEHVIKRLISLYPQATAYRMPPFALTDYAIVDDDDLIAFIEVKVRKESAKEIREKYGPLMLKARKVDELIALKESTKAAVVIAFAFNDATGDLYLTAPDHIRHKTGQAPPARKRFRGLPCDNEPVIYLDWDTDLQLVERGPNAN